ncbi:MAG: HAD hydrolase-like protein [Nitrospirae bacterium YQR-1]
MKAALFDLDDTLYPEMEFVKSGFKVVSEYMANVFSLDSGILFNRMMEILNSTGRGKVFDNILGETGQFSNENVLTLLYLYRDHSPDITLYDDVVPVITKLKDSGIKTAVITDGMASVQQNKIKALGLESLVDVVIYTDILGREYWKPSHVPFQTAFNLLGQKAPYAAVYVGDNPAKDFTGAEALGIEGVHIIRDEKAASTPVNFPGRRVIIRTLTEYFSRIEARYEQYNHRRQKHRG